MTAPDHVLLEALELLKAKAERKRQSVQRHDPIMCPCDTCRKTYKPKAIDQRHMVIDSTYRHHFEDRWEH